MYSLTSRQHIPGDGVGDGCEDPVELSEGSASVIEPARDPAPHTHTHHHTDGTVSATLTVRHMVDSEHKVATAQQNYHITFEEIYIYRHLLSKTNGRSEYSCTVCSDTCYSDTVGQDESGYWQRKNVRFSWIRCHADACQVW